MEEPLILERYRPLAELGSGGHGTVVLAFDTRMARRVAIKRLPLGHEARKAGLAEARTAAMLNHPEIVVVHEWDTDEDEAFLVMEHVNGISLADILDETGVPLDVDEAAAVLGGVARALAFAHDNGVLHLDIKPANILITRDGRVKVADFGVSALTGLSGRAHGMAGTIGYMPPEQIRAEELDARTDEWALASLAYELLTNANPFDSDSLEGSLFKIENADMPLPSDFEPSLTPGVD
ncbi:MAG: serine/threonine-protein kinase, partial [Coriobacteriia bacterium]|nr:serine/threonine-protein kinase [Coriobacteriia bacterium]